MTWGKLVLFTTGLPAAVLGYSYVTLAMIFFFAHKPAFEPGWVLTAQWRPWFDKIYLFSLTLGRGIIYKPDWRDDPTEVNTQLERHERVHIWQMEDNLFTAAILAIVIYLVLGDWILAVSVWASGIAWQAPHFVTAGLRFKDFSIMGLYYNAEHERSAYAQTDLCRAMGKSWQELRELSAMQGHR